MTDPRPENAPETTEPDGTPVENPSGSTFLDENGPSQALEVNRDLPLIDPSAS